MAKTPQMTERFYVTESAGPWLVEITVTARMDPRWKDAAILDKNASIYFASAGSNVKSGSSEYFDTA